MKRSIQKHGCVLCAALCLVAAGCARDEAEPSATPASAAADPAAGTGAGDSVFAPAHERETLPSSRIYYTLTQHAWYARGEPLLHENRAWHPVGMPVSASVPEMRAAGEYQGVEYYVREADTEPALYIPVFEGYWQAFRADTSNTRAN
jgi:hypothetical protein